MTTGTSSSKTRSRENPLCKQGYWSGVLLEAIPTVRSRFGEWNTPSLLLRGGDDVGVLGVVRERMDDE